MWIHQTKCSLGFFMLLPTRRKVKINSDEQHAIFAHELQSMGGMIYMGGKVVKIEGLG